MRRVLSELRYTAAVILAVDIAVVAVACVIALALGSFERGTVGFVVLGAAALAFLAAAASSGSLPMLGGPTFGGGMTGGGVNYTNTLHQELLLQQAFESDGARKELHRRRISGVGTTAIGLSLLVIGFAVVG